MQHSLTSIAVVTDGDESLKKKRGPKKGVKRGKYKKHKQFDADFTTIIPEESAAMLGADLTFAPFDARRHKKKRPGRRGRRRGRRRRMQADSGGDDSDSGGDGGGAGENEYRAGYAFRKRSKHKYNEDDDDRDDYYDGDDANSGDDDDGRGGGGCGCGGGGAGAGGGGGVSGSSDASGSDGMSSFDDNDMLFLRLSNNAGINVNDVDGNINNADSTFSAGVSVEKIFTHRFTEKDFPLPPSPEPDFEPLRNLHHKYSASERGLPSWVNVEENGPYVDDYMRLDVSNICPVLTQAEVDADRERLRSVAARVQAHRREVEPRTVAEYLVKLKGRAYIHTCWLDATEMDEKDRLKVKRYWRKLGVADEAEGLSISLPGIDPAGPDSYDSLAPPPKMENNDGNGGDGGTTAKKGNYSDERGIGKGTFFDVAYTEVDRIVGSTKGGPDGNNTTLYFVKWCGLPYTEGTWEREEDIDDPEKIAEYKRFHLLPAEKPKPPLQQRLWTQLTRSPEYKHQHTLRDFQLQGLNWLVFCWCHGRGSILADEMGLGKTVQSISFLQHLRTVQLIPGPFLVVAPLSTIANWKREVEEWTDMNVVVYIGNAQNREEIKRWEWFYLDADGQPLKKEIKFNVLLTTYDMVRHDAELPRIHWQVMVVDEAQNVKNFKGKLMEALRGISSYHKILLTGTPIQNSVEELWSLLQFIDQDKFQDRDGFLARFGRIEQLDQAQALRDTLKPYMLHRKKSDVDKDIPPLEETIIEVELSMLQKQYYRAIYERNRDFLSRGTSTGDSSAATGGGGGSSNGGGGGSGGGSNGPSSSSSSGGSNSMVTPLNNVMMQLRKVCDHPFLLENVESKEVPGLEATDYKAYINALVRASGKTVLIDKLLPKLKADGHKVLIFSQLKGVLNLLEKYLNFYGYTYERIDGSVKGSDRSAAINRFNRPGSDRFAFLLSTRAGGLGINLQAADTVILYDSDWNPQNDVQAQARSHRIGQKKQVKVYRLVTKDTYEKQMFEIASRKLGLDRAIMANVKNGAGGGNGNGSEGGGGGGGSAASPSSPTSSSSTGLDREEMQRLLKMGAYGLRKDEAESFKETEAFNESTIDDILEKRTKNVVHHDDGQGSQFSMATFTMNDTTADVKLDDPDFWKKTLPEAATSKALLSQFTEAINGNAEEKQEWAKIHKSSFLHRLEDVVDDVMKSFNEARGEISLTERSDALGLTQLCVTHTELFTDAEIARLHGWFDKLSSSCSRRKTRAVDYYGQEQASSSRRKQKKAPAKTATATARKSSEAKDGASEDGYNEYGNTRVASSSYMSDEEYEKKSKSLKLKLKKRKKITMSRGGDDDDDEEEEDDNGGDSGEDYEEVASNSGNSGSASAAAVTAGSASGEKKKKGSKKADSEENKRKWSSGDRRSLQDATFSFCRPYWAGIRARAKLTRKPLKEIRDAVLYFLGQVVACTKDNPKFNESFKKMVAFFIKNDEYDESDDDSGDNDDEKRKMKKESVANPALATDVIPAAYAAPEVREELKTLVPTRAEGWAKRWKIMEAIRNELAAAKAEGRRPLEKCPPLAKPLSTDVAWWDDPKALDADLFLGIYRHGWGSSDAILTDKTLAFSKKLSAKIEEYAEKLPKMAKPPPPLHKYAGWPTPRAIESHVRALIKALSAHKAAKQKQQPPKKKRKASPPAAEGEEAQTNGDAKGESKAKKTTKKKATPKSDKKKE